MASSSTAALELLPLEGATSSVWTHFGFPSSNGKIIEERKNRKQVYCRLCPKVLKYSGNTTNLRFHLQSAHSTVYKALVRSENKPKEAHPKHTHQGQTTIQESLEKRQPIPSTSARLFYHLFTIVDYL